MIINKEKLQDQINFYGIESNGNDEFLEPDWYKKRDAWISKSKYLITLMVDDHQLLEDTLMRKTSSASEIQRITIESFQFQNYKSPYEKYIDVNYKNPYK